MLRAPPWLCPWFLCTHSVFVLGSNHVSLEWKGEALRSEFTLSPMAHARALVVGPLGAWGVVEVYMG